MKIKTSVSSFMVALTLAFGPVERFAAFSQEVSISEGEVTDQLQQMKAKIQEALTKQFSAQDIKLAGDISRALDRASELLDETRSLSIELLRKHADHKISQEETNKTFAEINRLHDPIERELTLIREAEKSLTHPIQEISSVAMAIAEPYQRELATKGLIGLVEHIDLYSTAITSEDDIQIQASRAVAPKIHDLEAKKSTLELQIASMGKNLQALENRANQYDLECRELGQAIGRLQKKMLSDATPSAEDREEVEYMETKVRQLKDSLETTKKELAEEAARQEGYQKQVSDFNTAIHQIAIERKKLVLELRARKSASLYNDPSSNLAKSSLTGYEGDPTAGLTPSGKTQTACHFDTGC